LVVWFGTAGPMESTRNNKANNNNDIHGTRGIVCISDMEDVFMKTEVKYDNRGINNSDY